MSAKSVAPKRQKILAILGEGVCGDFHPNSALLLALNLLNQINLNLSFLSSNKWASFFICEKAVDWGDATAWESMNFHQVIRELRE